MFFVIFSFRFSRLKYQNENRDVSAPLSRLAVGRRAAPRPLASRGDARHPGELATKVGYFGVKSTKVHPGVQMGTKPAKVGRLAPGVLKCGAAPTPHRRGRLRKKVFDPRRKQSFAKVGAAGGPKLR